MADVNAVRRFSEEGLGRFPANSVSVRAVITEAERLARCVKARVYCCDFL
jgi:hypothetical protein